MGEEEEMAKDSQETRARLLDAVGRVLAQQGFESIGVNSVAREAGVDKVLIYRYFDGLKGLVAAFCQREGFWPTPLEIMGGDRDAFARKSYARQLAESAVNFLRAIRTRPLAQEVLAWRFLVQNELTDAFDSVRKASGEELICLLNIPTGEDAIDHQALMAIVAAAINHLGTRSGKLGEFAGVGLQDESGWLRIEGMIRKLVYAVAGESDSSLG
jgi:AcrR family transcriptional regulator